MPSLRALFYAAVWLTLFFVPRCIAHGQQESPQVPVFRSTTTLVFLDVTVVDKNGNPVVTGLTKDDFTITEDNKPQRIFSFEAPEVHTIDKNARDDNPDSKAPVTIFVLDRLNSDFEDFSYIDYSVRSYLMTQPEQLNAPVEMLVVGNDSLEMIQGYTRSRADLLYALDHLPATLPYKMMNGSFWTERFDQSIRALQQIALQSRGIPGRKNIVWVGHGGPGVNTSGMPSPWPEKLNRYMHKTTDMLVDARISLFVIYPGLKVSGPDMSVSIGSADADPSGRDPYAGNINFGIFANETGGKLFYNRNDVDMEMKQSVQLGSEYYTLTYQPPEEKEDGNFQRIRVTLRNPNLRAITKTGFYTPEKDAPTDPTMQTALSAMMVTQATIPFSSIEMNVKGVLRHPDTRSADITVQLHLKGLNWEAGEDGKLTSKLIMAAASLDGNQKILASKLMRYTVTSTIQDPAQRANTAPSFLFTIRVPRLTKNVRVIMETTDDVRMGSTEVSRKAIDTAPAVQTPEPQLAPRPVAMTGPATGAPTAQNH